MGFVLVILACLGICSPESSIMFKSKNLFSTEVECDAKGDILIAEMKNEHPEATIVYKCFANEDGI